MEIIFKAVSDIPEGSLVKLNFETGELTVEEEKESEFTLEPRMIGDEIVSADLIPVAQQKEEPNIIEGKEGG